MQCSTPPGTLSVVQPDRIRNINLLREQYAYTHVKCVRVSHVILKIIECTTNRSTIEKKLKNEKIRQQHYWQRSCENSDHEKRTVVETVKPHCILLVWSDCDEEVRTLTRAPGADMDGLISIFLNFFHTTFPEPISNFPQHAIPITFILYIYKSPQGSPMVLYKNWFSTLSLWYIHAIYLLYINYNIIHTVYKCTCRGWSRRTTTDFKYISKCARHRRLETVSTICFSLFVISFDFRGRRADRSLRQNRRPCITCALYIIIIQYCYAYFIAAATSL